MELIPYDHFATLRLAQFYSDPSEIAPLDNWEFMGGLWIGEGDGFTEFLRPYDRPDQLGSIELHLAALPESIALGILAALGLPLRLGFTLDEITRQLGPVEKTQVYVADRSSHQFTVGFRFPYFVSCTIHESDGLIHVVIIRKDSLLQDDAQRSTGAPI